MKKKKPGCLGYIGDYTTQLYGDYTTQPLEGSLLNNQYFMESMTIIASNPQTSMKFSACTVAFFRVSLACNPWQLGGVSLWFRHGVLVETRGVCRDVACHGN